MSAWGGKQLEQTNELKSLKGKVGKWDVHRDFDKLWNYSKSLERSVHTQGCVHAQSSAHAKQSPEQVPRSHLWLTLKLPRQEAKAKAEVQTSRLSLEDMSQHYPHRAAW